jgi:hypothetical protein
VHRFADHLIPPCQFPLQFLAPNSDFLPIEKALLGVETPILPEEASLSTFPNNPPLYNCTLPEHVLAVLATGNRRRHE